MKPIASFLTLVALSVGVRAPGQDQPAAQDAAGVAWRPLGDSALLRVVAAPVDGVALSLCMPLPDVGPEQNASLRQAFVQERADAADRTLPKPLCTQREHGRDFALFTVAMPKADLAVAQAWLAALLTPPSLPRAGKMLQRSLAQAALAADDAAWLFPGEILEGQAFAALFGARPADHWGDAQTMVGWRPEDYAAMAFQAPTAPLRLVVVGHALDPEALHAALRGWRPAGTGRPAPLSQSPAQAAAGEASVEHPRVDAAYVAAAMPCKQPQDGSGWLVAAVAVEAWRNRAFKTMQGYRGAEPLARAPFVRHEALLGDPLVLLFRRAATGAGPEVPRAEIEGLLAWARRRMLTLAECRGAARLCAAEWAAPPYSEGQIASWRIGPAALLSRARALALLGARGVEDENVRRLPDVEPDAVRDVLAAWAQGPLFWGSLLIRPLAQPSDGFPSDGAR